MERPAQGRRASKWHGWALNLSHLTPGPNRRAASDNANSDDNAKNSHLGRPMALWLTGANLADGAGDGRRAHGRL